VDICLENNCFEADKYVMGATQVGALSPSQTQLSCATACLANPACIAWNMIEASYYCMLYGTAGTMEVASAGTWYGAAECDPAASPLCASAGCCKAAPPIPG